MNNFDDCLAEMLLTESEYMEDVNPLLINFGPEFVKVYDSFCACFEEGCGRLASDFIQGTALFEIFKNIYRLHYCPMEEDMLKPLIDSGSVMTDDLRLNVYSQLFADFLNFFHSYFTRDLDVRESFVFSLRDYLFTPFKSVIPSIPSTSSVNSVAGWFNDAFKIGTDGLITGLFDKANSLLNNEYSVFGERLKNSVYSVLLDSFKSYLSKPLSLSSQRLLAGLESASFTSRIPSLVKKLPKCNDVLSEIHSLCYTPLVSAFRSLSGELGKNAMPSETEFAIYFFKAFNKLVSESSFDACKELFDVNRRVYASIASSINSCVYSPLVGLFKDKYQVSTDSITVFDSVFKGVNVKLAYTYQGKSLNGFVEFLNERQKHLV